MFLCKPWPNSCRTSSQYTMAQEMAEMPRLSRAIFLRSRSHQEILHLTIPLRGTKQALSGVHEETVITRADEEKFYVSVMKRMSSCFILFHPVFTLLGHTQRWEYLALVVSARSSCALADKWRGRNEQPAGVSCAQRYKVQETPTARQEERPFGIGCVFPASSSRKG